MEAALVTPASDPLLTPLASEGVPGELVVDARRASLLHLGRLGGGLLVTDTKLSLRWSLAWAGGRHRGLGVPHHECRQGQEVGQRGDSLLCEGLKELFE